MKMSFRGAGLLNVSFPIFSYVIVVILLFQLSVQEQKPCYTEYLDGTVSKLVDFSGLSTKTWTVAELKIEKLNHISISFCNKTHFSLCGHASFCLVLKNGSTFSSNYTYFRGNGLTAKLTTQLKGNSVNTIDAEIIFECTCEKVGNPVVHAYTNENFIGLSWATVAACPITNRDAFKNCVFQSNGLLHPIHLWALKHLFYYYTNDTKGNSYYLNICGGAVHGNVCGNGSKFAACQVNSSTTTASGINKMPTLSVSDDGWVYEIPYDKSKATKFMKIIMICNSSLENATLKYNESSSKVHIFFLESSEVCVKESIDCSTVHEQKKFDLTALSERSHFINNKESKFYISVCKPLNFTISSDGASICLEKYGKVFNLGYLVDGPRIKDENLVLQFTGGDFCNKGEMKRFRSLIIFKCSMTDNLNLKNISTDGCVYTFIWHTKEACPLMIPKFSLGSSCKVYDEVHGEFDFNPLYKDGDYHIETEDGVFNLNVCGSLSKPCNSSYNVSVCLTINGTQYAIGNTSLLPYNSDGRLGFTLSGNCPDKVMKSTVQIIFLCSHNKNLKSTRPQYFTKDNCTYYFIWYTDIACGSFEENNCTVVDKKGHVYDLSLLSSPESNIILYQNTSVGFQKLFINVCRSIVIGHGIRCHTKTGICLQNVVEPSNEVSFLNLGEVSALKYNEERKVLQMQYMNGEICHNGIAPSFNSLITFICDKGESPPELIKNTSCYYEFQWKTNHACSKEESFVRGDLGCKLYNPFSDIEYDLSPLGTEVYIFNSSNGDTYHLVICGTLNKTGQGIGICRETAKGCENLGMGNSELYFDAGSIFLNYTGGDKCTENSKKFTVIEFVCDAKNSGPKLQSSNNPCGFSIVWFTNLICSIPCVTASSRKLINISLLRDNDKNYKTNFDGTDYFINVCQPLVPMKGLKCNPGSAVCRAVPYQGKWMHEMDLGFPHYRPVSSDQNVVLTYSSNVYCPNLRDTLHNVSSSLKFICDPKAGKGNPVLHNVVSDCLYEFIWNTSIICDDHEMKLIEASPNKLLIDNNQDAYLDLQSLCRDKQYKIEDYVINLCLSSSLLEVRKIENNEETVYGTNSSIIFNYSTNSTIIFVSGGERCKVHPEKTYSVVLNIFCKVNENQLSFLKEEKCEVEFMLEGNVGCLQKIAHIEDSNSSYISIVGICIGTLLLLTLCAITWYYFRSPRNGCRRRINFCLKVPGGSDYDYALCECKERTVEL